MLSAPLTNLHSLPLPEQPLGVRYLSAEDMPFVFDSWIRSYNSNPWACQLGHLYKREQERRIRWCLAHGHGLAAYDEDAPEVVLGYCVGDRPSKRLDWVYVMRDARRRNIGRLLVLTLLDGDNAGTVRMTHRPRREWRSKIPQKWVWQPLTREELDA